MSDAVAGTTMGAHDEAARAMQAAALLARAGIAADVTVAGQAGEIAAVAVPAGRLHGVAAQSAALRALGFRYVAVDIGASGAEPDPG